MKIKKLNAEASMREQKTVFFEDQFEFIQNEPKVHTVDGLTTIHLDKHGIDGTFHMPNGLFNMPTEGNLFKAKMKSGQDAYFLVRSFTQDHVSAKGSITRICYVQDWNAYLKLAQVKN